MGDPDIEPVTLDIHDVTIEVSGEWGDPETDDPAAATEDDCGGDDR